MFYLYYNNQNPKINFVQNKMSNLSSEKSFDFSESQYIAPPIETNFTETELCAICCDYLKINDEPCLKNICRLGCEHIFHIGCVKQWLTTKRNCPICRENCKIYNGEKNEFEIVNFSNQDIISEHLPIRSEYQQLRYIEGLIQNGLIQNGLIQAPYLRINLPAINNFNIPLTQEPYSLTHLTFINNFNQPFNQVDNISDSLTHLRFIHSIIPNERIIGGDNENENENENENVIIFPQIEQSPIEGAIDFFETEQSLLEP